MVSNVDTLTSPQTALVAELIPRKARIRVLNRPALRRSHNRRPNIRAFPSRAQSARTLTVAGAQPAAARKANMNARTPPAMPGARQKQLRAKCDFLLVVSCYQEHSVVQRHMARSSVKVGSHTRRKDRYA